MIVLRNSAELREILRRIREYQDITGAQLGQRLHVDRRTIRGRDTGGHGYTADALIETAHALGYAVALIPLELAEERAA